MCILIHERICARDLVAEILGSAPSVNSTLLRRPQSKAEITVQATKQATKHHETRV